MDTQAQIKEIVTSHPVVLFMKGTPQFPQCGFSGNAINILRACGGEAVWFVKCHDEAYKPLMLALVEEAEGAAQ